MSTTVLHKTFTLYSHFCLHLVKS